MSRRMSGTFNLTRQCLAFGCHAVREKDGYCANHATAAGRGRLIFSFLHETIFFPFFTLASLISVHCLLTHFFCSFSFFLVLLSLD